MKLILTRFDLMKLPLVSVGFRQLFTGLSCLCSLLLILPGCKPAGETGTQDAAATDSGTITIYTVNEPLRYMAERLVDSSWAKVVFPAPDDVSDPAYWEPDADLITAYQQADLILLNGADYAGWIQTVSLPASRMVDTSQSYKDRLIMEEDGPTHQHGPEGEHSHAGVAFTTWLDFGLAQQQAKAIFEALQKRWPEHKEDLARNLSLLAADLQSLNAAMKKLGQQFGDTPVLGSHPVYQYLARAYDLQLHFLHWEPDDMPDEASWQALDNYLRETPTQWMLWEGTPNTDIKKALDDRQIKWTVFRPQGGKVSQGDFLSVMETNIESWQQRLE